MAEPLHGDEVFDPYEWPFFWITRTAARYLQKMDQALKDEGLDIARWRVLMSVGNRTVGVSEIAQLAVVKLPTMLKIVQRMEQEGLVVCEVRQSDARFTDVTLTEAGHAARRRAWIMAQGLYRSAFQGVPMVRQKALNSLMRDIFTRLGT